MAGVTGFVFDLDDTLYLERDYVRSGFAAVAEALSAHGCARAEAVFGFAWARFESGRRGRIFDELLLEYSEIARCFSCADLVQLYRSHRPRLDLLPATAALLDGLRARSRFLGLISDGFLEAQGNKIEALNLRPFFDRIVLTDQYGREFWKPHERAFAEMEQASGLNGARLVYIADNPRKDFIGPRSRGWHTVRVVLQGQVHVEADGVAERDAEWIVHGLEELMFAVRALEEQCG